jgi:hypothetical protein
MGHNPAPDASPRAFGLALAALTMAGGWALSMPFADALEGAPGFLGLVRFAALVGGTLALAGFGARHPGLVWGGVGASALLFFAARQVWPFLPLPMLLAAGAAWWQASRPPPPAPFWQPVPAPAPPVAPRRMP